MLNLCNYKKGIIQQPQLPAKGSAHPRPSPVPSSKVPTILKADRRERAQAPSKPHPGHSRIAAKPSPPCPPPSTQPPGPPPACSRLHQVFLSAGQCLIGKKADRSLEAGVDPVRLEGALNCQDACQHGTVEDHTAMEMEIWQMKIGSGPQESIV